MALKENIRTINRKIQEYIKVLQDNGVDVLSVYLFGSCAKGISTEESDIDLAIFINKKNIDSFQEDLKLMRLRRSIDLRIEPHSFAKADFVKPDPFVREILTTGKRII